MLECPGVGESPDIQVLARVHWVLRESKTAVEGSFLVAYLQVTEFGLVLWQSLFPSACVIHIDWAGLDHKPILIDKINKGQDHREVGWGSRFHFEEAWVQDSECRALVEKSWAAVDSGGDLGSRGGSVAVVLKDWNVSKRKTCDSELKSLKKELSDLFDWRTGMADFRRIKIVEDKIDGLLDLKERYWRQRSRTLWMKFGNKNTRFFHAKASQRRRKSKILGLMDNNRLWKTKIDDLESVIIGYFGRLFSSSSPSVSVIDSVLSSVDKKVSGWMNSILTARFTEDKVRTTLFQMAPLKAPGPDGFPAFFFQNF
ncbi:hypothetical protein ACOSP7_018285 [Xanthoceras sorbifolium]